MKQNNYHFVSLEDAIKNFSQVSQIVDQKGEVIIMQDNSPKYILSPYINKNDVEINEKDRILNMAKDILIKNIDVFKELNI